MMSIKLSDISGNPSYPPHNKNQWEFCLVTPSSPATAAPALDPILARAIKKVKSHVLPLFVIMFIVNYIDRVNIGFVRTHMEHDLGIGAAAYGLAPGCSSSVMRCSKSPPTCFCKKSARASG